MTSRLNEFFLQLGGGLVALRDRILRDLRSGIPTLAICLTLVLTLSSAVSDAKWVKDSSAAGTLLLWGMVVGWMLAGTRWPGWLACLYSLVFSGVFASLVIGQVLPPLRVILSTPYMPLVEGMRVRAVAFGLRAGGWWNTLQVGGSIRDTSLFVFLLALIGWAAAAWMMWWLVRRKRGLPAILPIYMLMAVNVHLSRQPRLMFAAFTFVALLAIARSAFAHHLSSWRRRRVDYSEELAPEWGVAAVLVALSAASMALVFSLVGTPDGLKLLSDLVESSRRQMSDTANQLFGGVKPPPPAPKDAQGEEPLPNIDTPNLGEIGSPLPQGNRTVMWVGLSDPSPLPPEASGAPRELISVPRHYWRSQIFAVYTGRGWDPAPLFAGEAAQNDSPTVPPGKYLLEQHYKIEARHSGVLFSVSDPISSTGITTLHRISPDYSGLVEGRASDYRIKSLATNVTVLQMEEASTDYTPEIRTAYLQLPAELPGRVRQLADEVVSGAVSPYQKVERIQEYLRTNYEYRLDAPLPPAGRDVVDYFLFDSSGGFCSHYASAMVVMLRSVGVPARVVAGYAMGSFDQRNGMYRVAASASHAWVEVFFPGYGWVEFEPTPAYQVFIYAAGSSVANYIPQSPLDKQLPEPIKQPSQLIWLLVPLAVVIGLWAVFLWGRWEKQRLAMPGKAALKLYVRVLRGLAGAGLPLQPSLTPDEFSTLALVDLELYPRLSDALTRATSVFIQSVYSPREPAIDDVLMGEVAWSEARGELLRLWFQSRLENLRPSAIQEQ
jgi:transglutaminase-like putative cysteine protease